MNLGNKSSNDLLFVNFNQDFSCVSVGTKHGYKFYSCEPFDQYYSKTNEGTGIVEMLFCTSLAALVGTGENPSFSSRHLQIINTKRQSVICELTFPASILAVKMNRRRLVVVLEEQIFIYDISNMKLLHTIDTSSNPGAICALSPSSENCYIAYPARSSSTLPFTSGQQSSNAYYAAGDVEIFDALSLQLVSIVQAHKSPIVSIAMNSTGTLLATASEKGTVIRVFSIPDASKVYQFRRGSYPTSIYSMTFNLDSTLLCVSSYTETVHIFKLSSSEPPTGNPVAGYGGLTGFTDDHSGGDQQGKSASMRQVLQRSSLHIGRNLAGSVGSYLPERITEMLEPARDFACVKLPNSGVRSLVALSSTIPQVMVVTSDGSYYQYSVDLENGGECVLLKQYSLLESSDDLINDNRIN